MSSKDHIIHPLPPVYDEHSRVLILGSIPSPASRAAGFYYGHPRNRFWPVLSALAGEPLPETAQARREFCLRHGIALWDVLAACDIDGAADASIEHPVANPLELITEAAPIKAVFCTGAKAYALYERLCQPSLGIAAVRLPSTSPANAACSVNDLLRAYAVIFAYLGEGNSSGSGSGAQVACRCLS